MRKFPIFLALFLLGCGSDGGSVAPAQQAVQHAPEISNLTLFPASAVQMEGAGSVAVTADIAFRDIGQDIQTLWIQMPDGTTVEHDVSANTQTGTLTANFVMSTAEIGAFAVEFWLEDEAGDSSTHHSVQFAVHWNAQSSDWTRRLSVPLPLLDVVWDGQVFVAVGYGGTILTSVDGIDWVARESVSDDVLVGLVAVGSDIYAVGGAGILLSTDHGETWTVKARPYGFIGTAVAASSSHVVVMGTVPDLGIPRITISEDGGETWQTTDFSWGTGDLIYRDGLFVTPAGSGVIVSTDGKQWSEIVVQEEGTGLDEIVVHDDSQFFVAGEDGTVFSSFDAFNWTELSTPLEDVDYSDGAWNGTQLILAGSVSWYRQDDTYLPIGISSSDGGASWDIFGIDTNIESRGLAWGNGRFVSVGRSALSDEGTIYTAD